VVVVEVRTEVGLERGLVVVVVVVGVVVVNVRGGVEVLLPGNVEMEEPEEPEGEPPVSEEAEQSVVPTWTVKGADCELAPVVSRINSPKLWPAETVTIQVNDEPVRLSQEKRAGPEGLSPGWTLKKNGPALP